MKTSNNKNLSYGQAMEQLEQLLENLGSGALDIDRMAAEVKQASDLINFCKKKLYSIEEEVNSVMESLDEA